MADLRSDTVTRPTPEMRRAMADAEVGDDVFGDDPTINRLQEKVAELFGKEAAIYVPSGSMANQVSIRAQTQPGDEIIAHADSHIYHYEGGAPSALSGCSLRLLPGTRGLFDATAVREAIRPVNSHFAQTRLVVVENTHNRGGGSIWPMAEIEAMKEWKREIVPPSTARAATLHLHMQHYHDDLLRDMGLSHRRKRGALGFIKELFAPYQPSDYADVTSGEATRQHVLPDDSTRRPLGHKCLPERALRPCRLV